MINKLLSLILAGVTSGFLALAQDKVSQVEICWEDGLKPPYLMLDDQKQPIGIAVEMVSEIFTRNHIGVKHVIRPWKRCLDDAQKGTTDIVPNASYKAERAEFALYSKPLYDNNLVLFYNKQKFPTPPPLQAAGDLAKYKIGGVLGFNYQEHEKHFKIDTGAKTREVVIEKLKLNRIDFALLQKEVLFALQK